MSERNEIILVEQPEGSSRKSFLACMSSQGIFDPPLLPGTKVYFLGVASPKTPPGTLATIGEVSQLVPLNCSEWHKLRAAYYLRKGIR
jgi:hypothetical protein